MRSQSQVTVAAGGVQFDGASAATIWFSPQDLVVDNAGNLYVADLESVHRVAPDLSTTTVAGAGAYATGADGGPAREAALDTITGIAVDRAGTTLYIAEGAKNRVRRVDLTAGTITTVNLGEVSLNRPGGLALDGAGNLFIADQGNYVVRRVDAVTGAVTTVAGSGQPGGSGDNGPAVSAQLSPVFGVEVDDAGTLWIADTQNMRVRRVDPSTGRITSLAIPDLFYPTRVRLDRKGRLLIADASGQRCVTFDPQSGPVSSYYGLVFPLAIVEDPQGRVVIAEGTLNRLMRVDPELLFYDWFASAPPDGDGGPALQSRLTSLFAVTTSPTGQVVFTDELAHKVRSLDPATGQIRTIAGDGAPGFLRLPKGLAYNSSGDLFLLDAGNNRILKRSVGAEQFEPFASKVRPGDGLAVGSDGNLYMTFQYALYRINAGEGPHERIAASTLFEGAVGLASDGAGNVYVAERDAGRIRKIELSSQAVSLFADGLAKPAGIAFDSSNNLWVAESGAGRITRIGADGAKAEVVGSFGFPGFLTLSEDSVYFTDLRSPRVYRAPR
ncbi:MAG TPA: NHL repeat-containing protein [Bryobacteraceae bacterium]|jgi:sugar lactone lactonase YvrE|nr:NHL repeat-containing protein [Bryobacteraceae bacterium]